MKYIDADRLKAEIERRKYEWQAILDKNNDANSEVIKNIIYEDENILNIIASLQQEQPEVDLEKEFQEYWYLHQYDHRLRRQVMDGHGKAVLRNVAGHFYELSRARKEG